MNRCFFGFCLLLLSSQLSLSTVPEVLVLAKRPDTVATTVAGALSLRELDFINQQASSTLAKSLLDLPGVTASSRNQSSQTRLSIRGSGIARSADVRGIALQLNGLPLNAADADFDYLTAIEPLALAQIRVVRSAHSVATATNNLGGSIDFISKKGLDQNASLLRTEFGSFGYWKQHASSGWDAAPFDVFVSVDNQIQDGFREQSQLNRQHFNFNLGWKISDELENRITFTRVQSDEELPGALTKRQKNTDPTQAASSPNPLFNRRLAGWRDEVSWNRLANQFNFQDPDQNLNVGVWYSFAEIDNPRNQVFTKNYQDTGLRIHYGADSLLGENENHFSLTFTPTYAWSNERSYENLLDGARGGLLDDADKEWLNADLFIQNRYKINQQLSWITSLQLGYAKRSVTDHLALIGEALTKDSVDYTTISPSTGLLYELNATSQLYWNLSQSTEAPTHGDLYQSGSPRFISQKAQQAITTEIGTRGNSGSLKWDLAYYHSWLKNEFLISETFPGSGLNETRNTPRSTHQGVEAGLDWELIHEASDLPEHSLVLSPTSTWNSFYLTNDSLYQNNQLPGIPEFMLQCKLNYQHSSGFFAGASWLGQPASTYADYANTLKSDPSFSMNLRVGYGKAKGFHIFFEIENVTDENSIIDISVTGNARGQDQRVFWPAPERSFNGGLSWVW